MDPGQGQPEVLQVHLVFTWPGWRPLFSLLLANHSCLYKMEIPAVSGNFQGQVTQGHSVVALWDMLESPLIFWSLKTAVMETIKARATQSSSCHFKMALTCSLG